jgi:hypothetical protein
MRRREFIGNLIGTAVAWPLAVRAQQPAKAIVSLATPVEVMSETSSLRIYKALFGKLRRLGYIEGQNLIVERYSGEGKIAHYAEVASEVLRQQPDVILANTSRMVLRLKEATSTIPIVGLLSSWLSRVVCRRFFRMALSLNLAGLLAMGMTVWIKFGERPATLTVSSKARRRANCQSSWQQNLSWSLISRPPRRSVSQCHRSC